MSKVIGALGRFVRTSFGAALAGGLVVAIVGLIAISAGWVKSSDNNSNNEATTLAATPLPQPAPREASAKGLTVNQIYQQDSPGVAFIQAQQAPQASSRSIPSAVAAEGPRPARASSSTMPATSSPMRMSSTARARSRSRSAIPTTRSR